MTEHDCSHLETRVSQGGEEPRSRLWDRPLEAASSVPTCRGGVASGEEST